MGRRWKQKEEEALTEIKRVLKDELASRPQFPDGKIAAPAHYDVLILLSANV
jgi:hypothetical protein